VRRIGFFLLLFSVAYCSFYVIGCTNEDDDDDSAIQEYSVGGTVIGLLPGMTLVLQLNTGSNLSLTQFGAFSFTEKLPEGSTYTVTVVSSPGGHTTTILNGSGTINGNDVADVIVLVQNISLPGADLMVVVNDTVFPLIAGSIAHYINDLASASFQYLITTWTGGTAQELRDFIASFWNQHHIKGVFLIGNFPAAWYEMVTFDGEYGEERWPCDFYLMDLDGSWIDADGDGIFDQHSPLFLDLFLSRLIGTASEINAYFSKNQQYRLHGSQIDRSAFIFKDDDWKDYYFDYDFNLSGIYPLVDICQEFEATTRVNYIAKLTGNGAEYVYQWIHSAPTNLQIRNGDHWESITISDIITNDFKGAFYNLYNCSASRFTEENLATTYLMKTNFGLATIGSTKIGGNYWPIIFHDALASGETWGRSFQSWYQGFGVDSDSWFLGMCLQGDPLLTISGQTAHTFNSNALPPPSESHIKQLEMIMAQHTSLYKVGTFEEYKTRNPEFF